MARKKRKSERKSSKVGAEPRVRPYHETMYDPRFIEGVIEAGGRGASEAEMAVLVCGVTRMCMREWGRKFPEFGKALQMAREASLVWWEANGQMRLRDKGFNDRLYKTIMSARFRKDYGDHVTVGGDTDNPMVTRIERVIVKAAKDAIR